LVEKPEGKRPPGRPKSRWTDNDLIEIEAEGVLDSSRQAPVVCSSEHGNEPSRPIKGGKFLE
jgi:hypothetical protein